MNFQSARVGLEELAEQYDTVCRDQATHGDINGLPEADKRLWCITEQLCHELQDAEDAVVSSFRRTVFKDKVLKWFVQHPQTARLWEKPAGYSGDHATIEWLCANLQSWTCLRDIFSNHVLRCTMAQQHREKVIAQQAFFMSILSRTSGGVHIADVGCGPSIALKSALEFSAAKQPHVLLVDLDPAALECSRTHLSAYSSNMECEYSQGDVVQTLRRLGKSGQAFDAITFGGLFDYLPDRVIVFVLKKSLSLLKPGGALFFTQVSRYNPDKTFMDWWGDWRLIERDEAELVSLCHEAGIATQNISMHRVPTNCAVVATIQTALVPGSGPML
jgi:SAM-dependent methyltransferase